MDLKTFSRKQKDPQVTAITVSDIRYAIAYQCKLILFTSLQIRHDILRDINTLNIGGDQSSFDHTPAKDAGVPAQARHARWRRAATEKENAVVTQKQQLAEIKAYFEEVMNE